MEFPVKVDIVLELAHYLNTDMIRKCTNHISFFTLINFFEKFPKHLKGYKILKFRVGDLSGNHKIRLNDFCNSILAKKNILDDMLKRKSKNYKS